IVIIVASALILSAAVSRSGIVELAMSYARFDLSTPRRQIVTLTACVAAISAFVKNIGTLAMRSEEHTSELQSLMRISYAVFCLKKNTLTTNILHHIPQN